jgi:hypothetical protein
VKQNSSFTKLGLLSVRDGGLKIHDMQVRLVQLFSGLSLIPYFSNFV